MNCAVRLVRGRQWFSGFLEYYNKMFRDDEAKLQKFRQHVKEGDNTTDGIVIQVKGNLIKIHTDKSRCTQFGHNGECLTPTEIWLKRSKIYPRN